MGSSNMDGATLHLRRHILVKLLILVVFFNSFEATSSASELSTTITFVSKDPGTNNLEMRVTYPESIDCNWPKLTGYGSSEIEYGSCPTMSIKYEVISNRGPGKKPGALYFSWFQKHFIDGQNSLYGIWTPWLLLKSKDADGVKHQLFDDGKARFYGPGVMEIDFRPVYSESYSVSSSLPRIRLLGPTKAERIAEEVAEEKAEEKRRLEEERRWEFDIFNDGIDNFIYVDQGYSSGDQSTLRIYCENKSIGAWISADYPQSRGWKGKAQIRFDSKPVKQLSYTVNRQFDLISIDNPKAFISEFLKSKEVLVKIWTATGSQLSSFHIGDLKNYKKRFAAKGCNLG
jgi:hypothetical protein